MGERTLLNLIIFCKAVAFSLFEFPIHNAFYSSSISACLNFPLDFELSEPLEDTAFVVEERDRLHYE